MSSRRRLHARRRQPSVTGYVRIIAATNATSTDGANASSARPFFRLNVFPITLPPLRERSGTCPSSFASSSSARRDATRYARRQLALYRYAYPATPELEYPLARHYPAGADPSCPTSVVFAASTAQALKSGVVGPPFPRGSRSRCRARADRPSLDLARGTIARPPLLDLTPDLYSRIANTASAIPGDDRRRTRATPAIGGAGRRRALPTSRTRS